MDVDRMLRSMSSTRFEEWRVYEELEPFPNERADWGMAHIVQAIMRTGKKLSEFMLPFGDYVVSDAPVVQTVEFQERILDDWIFIHNAMYAAKAGRN